MIKFLTSKAVAYALVKIIQENRIKKEAVKIAQAIDKASARAFGERQSEKIQVFLEDGLQLFTDTIIKVLREDRKK